MGIMRTKSIEQLDVVELPHRRTTGVRAHEHPGEDVAQDQGQPEPLRDESSEKGRYQNDR